MKKILFISAILFLFFACDDDENVDPKMGIFAVANRGEGTVTIYDAATQSLTHTIELPGEAAPTYVVQSPETGYLYISDFSAGKVWVYNSMYFTHVTDYPIEQGGFHMWVNDNADQLWVNNIVSKTTTVLDSHTGEMLKTFPLVADGIKFGANDAQHDVFISPNGQHAYVSVISPDGPNYVLQYSTRKLEFVDAIEVGGDPHLSGSQSRLHILSQAESSISEHKYHDMRATGTSASIMNAHGVTNGGGKHFYVTNIAGREVVSYNANKNEIYDSEATIAEAGVAHNLAYSPEYDVVALTISGGSTVEFYDVSDKKDISVMSSTESGANPFGIWYYTVHTNHIN